MDLAPVWLSIVLPSLVGILSFALGKRSGHFVTLASAISLLIISSFAGTILEGTTRHFEGFAWWNMPQAQVSFGLILDPLSVLMGLVVSFISFIVFLYSIGYMRGEEGGSRFWFFMACFESSMLLLVFSDNFIMSFLGWEGVGLCSYFLIGHYYEDARERWLGGPEGISPFVKPTLCGEKALLTTGLADSIMLVGILLIHSIYGTFNFAEIQSLASTKTVDPAYLFAASALLIFGPLGKSAQFPFNEWLPEAMSGPTPVSALLHSATMVKAGVYLVARVSPIFYALSAVEPASSTIFFLLAGFAGIMTALLGSVYGTFAHEMKKILAYSTMSQLGFIFVALSVAGISGSPLLGLSAALFHILSHSIFKASLFLGAGSAIHLSHTNYVTEMGGLRKAAPKTFAAMVLSGLSLCALPPLLGFWSKDAILAAVYPVNVVAASLLAAASVMTSFYTIRLLWYAFLAPGDKPYHSKEAWIIVGPPLLLSALTLFFGPFGPTIEHALTESLHVALDLPLPNNESSTIPMALSIAALSLGLGIAYFAYFKRNRSLLRIAASLTGLRQTLLSRPIDMVYHFLSRFILSASKAAYGLESLLNSMNMGMASATIRAARRLSGVHSGDLNRYLGIAAALLLLLLLLLLVVV